MSGKGTTSHGVLAIHVAQSAQDWRKAKAPPGRGAGGEADARLCQLISEDGKPGAVLVGCAAAWHPKDRDKAVGWDAVTRSSRGLSRV